MRLCSPMTRRLPRPTRRSLAAIDNTMVCGVIFQTYRRAKRTRELAGSNSDLDQICRQGDACNHLSRQRPHFFRRHCQPLAVKVGGAPEYEVELVCCEVKRVKRIGDFPWRRNQ